MALAHDPASRSLAAASEPKPAPDPLSDVLRTVRLTGALFFVVDATDPWGVEVPHADAYAGLILPRARHVISYHIVLEGGGWAGIPGGASTAFAAGDILVFAHADPYAMLSAPGQPPEYDARASVVFFRDMAAGRLPFVVPEGGGGMPRTRFVCGFLGCDLAPFNPVLATLPPLLRVRRAADGRSDLLDGLVAMTLEEAQAPRAGGESIRLRLSELMFAEVVRRHLETLPPGETGWLAGLRDPGIGRVLALIHGDPARPWTLPALAEAAGLSRAVLAARFAQLVGCPPIQYLTRWRMQLAGRMLTDGAGKVAAVAYAVGYDSEAAFSRAFKKIAGVPPSEWRAGQA